ncbi:MAG: histidine kinase [Pseudomonadota bacterium]
MWITIGVVHGLSRYADIVKYDLDVEFSLSDIGYYVASYSAWVVVTVALLRTLSRQRFPFTTKALGLTFLTGVFVWLPMYFSYDYAIGTLVEGGTWADWWARYRSTSGSVVFFYAVVYALTFALCAGLVLGNRTREAQRANSELQRQQAEDALALSKQQMQLMQAQLSPHFLFNSLGSISYLARVSDDGAPIVRAVAKLGALLRFTIANASRDTVTIAEEVEFVESYLELQALRFKGRFKTTMNLSGDLSGTVCLPFTLQPLVENVFRHVIEQHAEIDQGTHPEVVDIVIEAVVSDSVAMLKVRNSRPEGDVTRSEESGTGLQNLETRMRHRFGDHTQLETEASETHYEVSLAFPARMVTHDG